MNKKDKKENEYKKKLEKTLSNFDFIKYLGNDVLTKIYKYTDLEQMKNIYDLLPNEKDYAIIFTEFEPRKVGHWVCLTRYNDHGTNTFCYFDSYGKPPDYQLKYVPKIFKSFLDEDKNEISRLLKTIDSNYSNVIYNSFPLQSTKNNVNTCGRWVASFCKLTGVMLYNYQNYIDLILNIHKQTGKPYDIIVCEIT